MNKSTEKKFCAMCGKEIEDYYLMVGDNYLQVKYFEEQDGSDNVFCSKNCLCEALSVIEVEVKKWKQYY